MRYGAPRSLFYRAAAPLVSRIGAVYPAPTRGLPPSERKFVLDTLDSARFQDSAPREVYATLLDDRIHLRHPHYAKPELLATGTNQVWCWDITALRGPDKWPAFYLYNLMDVHSRYIVGWLIAETQSAALAELQLIRIAL